jgi:ketosteroid isomerase-like protein
MSEENVERVSRLIEHVNTTGELGPDFDSVFHPEIEFEDEIGAYNTRDELRAFLQGFAQAIGGLHLEIEETRDLGDVIMLVVQQSGQGSASGVPIAQQFTWVMRFADDRCVRWRIYADHGRALEDAGRSE